MSSRIPNLRLRCCLCRKLIAQRVDVFRLDGEWHRRFPQMVGSIACQKCAQETEWGLCDRQDGSFPEGHVTSQTGGSICDSWAHVTSSGTQRAVVALDPESGVRQGGREYLASVISKGAIADRHRAKIERALLQSD